MTSLRAALFDVQSGNDEVLAAKGEDVVPIGVVDLRDPIGAERELDRLVSHTVRAVRLFPEEQHIEPDFPSVRLIAKRATALGLPVLIGGDVRRFWRPLSGLGAVVVFLDTHFYHLGDFLVVARDEPGFHTSTRLLNSPDALETVAAHVGAGRLLFGSRTPGARRSSTWRRRAPICPACGRSRVTRPRTGGVTRSRPPARAIASTSNRRGHTHRPDGWPASCPQWTIAGCSSARTPR